MCGGYLGLGRDYVDHILNPDTKLSLLIVARLCREDTHRDRDTETGPCCMVHVYMSPPCELCIAEALTIRYKHASL